MGIANRTLVATFKLLMLSTILLINSAPAYTASPCEIAFRKYYSKYLAKKPIHYAVSTTGGRSLAAPSTSCGISSGQLTKKLSMKESLKTCRREKSATGSPGACKVIKSR
jgi:hypothetical protein